MCAVCGKKMNQGSSPSLFFKLTHEAIAWLVGIGLRVTWGSTILMICTARYGVSLDLIAGVAVVHRVAAVRTVRAMFRACPFESRCRSGTPRLAHAN